MASSRLSIAKPPAKSSAATAVAKSSGALQTRPFAPRHDDAHDQESEGDLMARSIQARLMDVPVYPPESSLQRSPDTDKEDEDLTIQPKLTIGQPGDKYEQEADQMAAKVMRMPTEDVAEEEKEEEEQMKPALQRQAVPEEEEEILQARPQIQAKGLAPQVPANFSRQLAQQKGGGQPLSNETRAFMEPRFGVDFGDVRVHETPDLTNAIQAQAFTHGQDVYFNSGKYNPESNGGKELLAHELTHVTQQSGLENRTTIHRQSNDPKERSRTGDETTLSNQNKQQKVSTKKRQGPGEIAYKSEAFSPYGYSVDHNPPPLQATVYTQVGELRNEQDSSL